MAARAGCTYLIDVIRTLTQAGTAEYSLGTANLWDADHIQYLLDEHRLDIERIPVDKIPTVGAGGTITYTRHSVPYSHLEGTASYGFIEEADGDNVTGYTPDFQRGLFTFDANTAGTSYFFTGRAFDVYGAAADLLEQWASYLSRDYDFNTSGLGYKRSQAHQQMLAQAEKYRQKQWAGSVQLVRLDTN